MRPNHDGSGSACKLLHLLEVPSSLRIAVEEYRCVRMNTLDNTKRVQDLRVVSWDPLLPQLDLPLDDLQPRDI